MASNFDQNFFDQPTLEQAPPAKKSSPTVVPIQRTIIEEGAQEPASITVQQSSQNQASHSVLLGLAAIVLIIVAIGAMAMYWKRSASPIRTTRK